MLGGAALAGAIAIFATTEPDRSGHFGGDFEARMWGGLLIPIGIGYTVDALNARGDASACRAYQDHQRERAISRPAPPQ